MNKKKISRTHTVVVRVTKKEKEILALKAQQVKKTTSSFLRDLSLNYTITSKIDQIALEQLMKTKADFGRVGGLFKIWLMANEEIQEVALLDGISYHRIENIVDRLEIMENELLAIARKLL